MKPSPSFLLIAHRGDSAARPENTFDAFDLALQQGFSHLETDCLLSADNICIVLHDEKLGRTNNGTGTAFEQSAEYLQALDAGSWFSPEFKDCKIPTLQELLERYHGTIHLHLELKSAQPALPLLVAKELQAAGWVPESSTSATAGTNSTPSSGSFDEAPGLTITSFHLSSLQAFQEVCPGVRCGWLVHDLSPDVLQAATSAGMSMVCPRANIIQAAEVKAAVAAGLVVRAWGIKSLQLLEDAVAAGAHGGTVNWPALAAEALHGLKVQVLK